jgi:hypothetical protein
VSRRLADLPPLPPLTGDILEAVLRLTLPSLSFLLLGLPLGFALRHRIGPARERLPSFGVAFAGLLEGDERILPKDSLAMEGKDLCHFSTAIPSKIPHAEKGINTPIPMALSRTFSGY